MKRLSDLVVSLVLLSGLGPLLAFLFLAGLVFVGNPILFRQPRPGLHGRPFTLIKFRTMRHGLDKQGNPLPDDQRMTRYGSFLRRSSLDELPELWNVLKGEMSLVGPRPLLMEYLPLYSPRQARRHEVRPGITGWSQVQGRNLVGWEERLEMDVWYVENRSFWLDIKILFLTVWTVLRGTGVSQKGHVTMEKFKG